MAIESPDTRVYLANMAHYLNLYLPHPNGEKLGVDVESSINLYDPESKTIGRDYDAANAVRDFLKVDPLTSGKVSKFLVTAERLAMQLRAIEKFEYRKPAISEQAKAKRGYLANLVFPKTPKTEDSVQKGVQTKSDQELANSMMNAMIDHASELNKYLKFQLADIHKDKNVDPELQIYCSDVYGMVEERSVLVLRDLKVASKKIAKFINPKKMSSKLPMPFIVKLKNPPPSFTKKGKAYRAYASMDIPEVKELVVEDLLVYGRKLTDLDQSNFFIRNLTRAGDAITRTAMSLVAALQAPKKLLFLKNPGDVPTVNKEHVLSGMHDFESVGVFDENGIYLTEVEREELQRNYEAQIAAQEARDEADRVAEEARVEAERVAEEARLEAERVVETERLAEEARLEDERNLEAERIEAERLAEETRLAEEARLESDRVAAADRVAEEARVEAERVAESERQAEAARTEAAVRVAEAQAVLDRAKEAADKLVADAKEVLRQAQEATDPLSHEPSSVPNADRDFIDAEIIDEPAFADVSNSAQADSPIAIGYQVRELNEGIERVNGAIPMQAAPIVLAETKTSTEDGFAPIRDTSKVPETPVGISGLKRSDGSAREANGQTVAEDRSTAKKLTADELNAKFAAGLPAAEEFHARNKAGAEGIEPQGLDL